MIIFGSPNRNRSRYNPDTVVIGTQTWALENFAEGTLIDGTVIPEVTDNAAWSALTTAAWCNYNNDAPTGAIYGKLYNWWARALIDAAYAQYGWRTPTDAEFSTLVTYLGGSGVAGGKLKEAGTSHWTTPNTGADNSSGFTALPGGRRRNSGVFEFINTMFFILTSEYNSANAFYQYLFYNDDNTATGNVSKKFGSSIRLIKI